MPTEASIFSRYLIGEEPNEKTLWLYSEAQKKIAITSSGSEAAVVNFVNRFPLTVSMFDSALAWIQPTHALRKKIYIMFCILESRPEYSAYFLPKHRKKSYLFTAIIIGLRSVLNALAGFLLLPVTYLFSRDTLHSRFSTND